MSDNIKKISVFAVLIIPLLLGMLFGVVQQTMGILLICLGILKIADIKQFTKAFSSYDFFAKRSIYYATIYPFLELAIGIVLLFTIRNIVLQIALLLLFMMMTITLLSIIFKKNKNKQHCACLGIISRKLNIPLSIVSIGEASVMIVMVFFLLVA